MLTLQGAGQWFAGLSFWAKTITIVCGPIAAAGAATPVVMAGYEWSGLPRLVSEQAVDHKIHVVRHDDIEPIKVAQAQMQSYISEQQLSNARNDLSNLQKEKADWEIKRPTFSPEQQPLVNQRVQQLDVAISQANDRITRLQAGR